VSWLEIAFAALAVMYFGRFMAEITKGRRR
jgi:hypothetical protein